MAKLKFDRIVNIKLKVGEKGTVPDDEVWKGTLTYTSQLKINDNTMESYFSPSSGGKYGVNPILSNIILGGGAIFSPQSSGTGSFTGVAFKVIN